MHPHTLTHLHASSAHVQASLVQTKLPVSNRYLWKIETDVGHTPHDKPETNTVRAIELLISHNEGKDSKIQADFNTFITNFMIGNKLYWDCCKMENETEQEIGMPGSF